MNATGVASATIAVLALAGLTAGLAGSAQAQSATTPTPPSAQSQSQSQPTASTAPLQLPEVNVSAPAATGGYATQPQYNTPTATVGPLGNQQVLNTPTSISVVPEDVMVNQQARTVNDTLRFLPSVEVRDQQGFEVSRPQSRGFQSSIVQNTRLDGLNIIGTTAIPTENLSGIQVLNGLAGSLYGPETPAGVFNYILKRPTDTPLERFIEGFDSNGIFTEQVDLGGRTGPDNKVGYRVNLVHGEGEDYVSGSNLNRTLFSADLDFHLDDQTVLETDYSHYQTNSTGLPGSIVYDGGKSTLLPKAVDPTRIGYGQPGAGADLITDTGLVKIKHTFNQDWSMEVGGLYQNAVRNLFGITNTMTDNAGDFTVTKNFTAIPHFTIGSNTASLNGHVDILGMRNDVTIGTNGFINNQYSYRNSIATMLGTSTLANPVVLPWQPLPANGGQYESAMLTEQSIIVGDMIHFNEQWALQGVLSTSFIHSTSYNVAGKVTSSDQRDGALSPTVSLIYKPVPRLTLYTTYAESVEEGDQAPAGTANVNQFMAPYQDKQYEIGAKYAVTKDLLITLDGFHMTRPLAATNAATNIFSVVGTQRNNGMEMFVQGNVTPDLSVFGGLTYIDARLLGTGNSTTDGKLVVGVPNVKSDFLVDYHPHFVPGLGLTGAVHYESNRAATNTNYSFAPSYATLDLGVRYTMPVLTHQVTGRFQVINVTDQRYYVSIADGNIVGSPGANTAYLGAPRTFVASLEFDF
ncbi:MAG: TonB-dependent siderophore receptor [Acetobacteraceae bacterium]|nr:TonB-dependent siderophore receptor [Acetobacteraceae bacterium]